MIAKPSLGRASRPTPNMVPRSELGAPIGVSNRPFFMRSGGSLNRRRFLQAAAALPFASSACGRCRLAGREPSWPHLIDRSSTNRPRCGQQAVQDAKIPKLPDSLKNLLKLVACNLNDPQSEPYLESIELFLHCSSTAPPRPQGTFIRQSFFCWRVDVQFAANVLKAKGASANGGRGWRPGWCSRLHRR